MNKTALTGAGVALLLSSVAALADTTVNFPEDSPAVSITFPDGWKVEHDDSDTVTAKSADDEIEFNLWGVEQATDPKAMLAKIESAAYDVAGEIKEYISYFKATERARGVINGIDTATIGGSGTDKEEGEEVDVSATFLSPDNKRLFVLMYWGSEEGEAKHKAELQTIVKSLKKASGD